VIRVAAGALVYHNGKVLLVKHSYESRWSGKWILPGGFPREGELLSECCLRELKEETGIEAKVIKHAATVEKVFSDGFHILYVVYWCAPETTELRLGAEISEAKWALVEELPELAGELHEDTLRILVEAGLLPEASDRS